jgi:hypothetical protein
MNDLNIIKEFHKGRVVVERLWDNPDSANNPGHVVGFVSDSNGKVVIRVEFANGDRYNVSPEDLDAL